MARASRQILAPIISEGSFFFFFLSFFLSFFPCGPCFTGTQQCTENDILTTYICIFHVNQETDTEINVDKTEIH